MSDPVKKSRSAAAFMSGMNGGKADAGDEPGRETAPKVVGAWAAEGRARLRERFEEVEEEAKKANEVQFSGIIDGQIPILIPTQKISDIVGTDRIVDTADGDDADGFKSLVSNIRQRGQRVPIRVRPTDVDWRPNAATPRDVTHVEFALQSGRRRLAACKELGIDVLCFLSFSEEGKERLDDLHERFYENSVRKDLTQIERLYSIGLISRETPGTSQAQLSEIIGVNRSTVNRGCGVVEYYNELAELLDLATASRDEIDKALKQLRSGNRSEHPLAKKTAKHRNSIVSQPLPFRTKQTSGGTLSLSRSSTGDMILKIKSKTIPDEKLAEILRIMESAG
ncbi:ParB/RepB/Spo0J family partition protein [Loktanella sp. DJP18]|uniref:ParB/RepB/Spo0J family partition protein n=1 Tax=Loktanella sp. DJP18 TaxID=3409788 RepID=UPI003BB66F0B